MEKYQVRNNIRKLRFLNGEITQEHLAEKAGVTCQTIIAIEGGKYAPSPAPRLNEVLVKVRATTVTIGDCRMRGFTVPPEQWLAARLYLGVFRPRRRILGMELAGDIEAVGARVTRFEPGDPVFASTFEADWGGYAEYKCFPENGMLVPKPTNLDYGESAAAVGGGATALRCLRQANIQPGQKVLGYGASGAVGTNVVQLARRPAWPSNPAAFT